jgi:hypothetical protein
VIDLMNSNPLTLIVLAVVAWGVLVWQVRRG